MNKSEFAKALAARADLTGVQAQKVTEEFLGLLTESIAKGDRIAFLGFGTFSTAKRAARTGVNPRNPGQKVKIPARTVVKFTPGAPLKAAANTGKVAKKTAAKPAAKKAAPAAKKPAARKPAAKKPAAKKK
jgi:DNA-binding protein HU-beta